MEIDLKLYTENHKSKVLNQLDKMILASQKIDDFKRIVFDFIYPKKNDLDSLKLKNVIYVFKIKCFGDNLNEISFVIELKE